MSESQLKITFQPNGRSVFVLRGTTILEAAARAGMVIETPCGGAGTCGKCRVQVTLNPGAPSSADKKIFSSPELEEGWRLACRNTVESDMTVFIPGSSLFGSEHQILTSGGGEVNGEVCPAIKKVYVELVPPSLEDSVPDLLRLEKVIGSFKTDLSLAREIPVVMRNNGFKGTAILADNRLIGFEPGDTGKHCFGVAFDIGTTTIVGKLLSLCEGRELGVVSRMNPQVSFGDDVLARIKHAGTCSGGLDEMRSVLIREISGMIDVLCSQSGVGRENIYEAAFAGNTTMEHILCGINPAPLGQIPFTPAHARGLLVPASELGFAIQLRALAYVFPIIGGFVGGDTVAGMLATRLDLIEGPVLMVDVGTNGEIVLADKGRFYAASTAAGPAFEGARISCGMRGTRGAIEKVVFDGDVRLEVIGDTVPAGICGSGLIDLMAELLNHGIVTCDGRLLPRAELPRDLSPAFAKRVETDENGETCFVIFAEASGRPAERVVLTQRDVREVQLGSGAVRAGISILLKKAGLKPQDINTVLIAGGFGNFIRRSSAQRIGLLPGGIDHQSMRYVGNVSLAGAETALLSTKARRWVEDFARRVTLVELSTADGFHEEFADAMIFP